MKFQTKGKLLTIGELKAASAAKTPVFLNIRYKAYDQPDVCVITPVELKTREWLAETYMKLVVPDFREPFEHQFVDIPDEEDAVISSSWTDVTVYAVEVIETYSIDSFHDTAMKLSKAFKDAKISVQEFACVMSKIWTE